MTARQHRLVILLCCIVGSLLVSLALQNIPPSLGWHAAYAQGAPDPLADPAASLSLFAKLYHSGAYLCLGIVVVFAGLRWASNHITWLEAPNRAHYVTAALAGLALIALPASQGTTPNLSMIVSAVGMTLATFAPGLTSKQGS